MTNDEMTKGGEKSSCDEKAKEGEESIEQVLIVRCPTSV